MAQPSAHTDAPQFQDDAAPEQRIQRNQALIALLDVWEQEDETEQRDTLQFLMKALDEDRLSSRKLFS